MLSPNLFALYGDDLAQETKQADPAIWIDDMNFSTLFYANDIVLVAENYTF